MTKFSEIGIEFPLFAAPIEDAIVDEPGQCVQCGKASQLLFNESCYTCFRAGKGSKTVDTEYGMVRPEDAIQGHTHGLPLDPGNLPNLPLIAHPVDPNFPDEHWYSVKFRPDDLIELTRTPTYHTWQGERWLFCCGRPAVFTGSVDSDALAELAIERGSSKAEILSSLLSISEPVARRSLNAIETGSGGLYMFRCQNCSTCRAHFDIE